MEEIDLFIAKTKADIRIGGEHALYFVKDDFIELPDPATFPSKAAFYGVAFHELIHWARHPHRLNSTKAYISPENPIIFLFYRAYEELVANIGEGLLCIRFGLNPDADPDRAQRLADNFKQTYETPDVIEHALKRAKRAVRYLGNCPKKII